MQLIKANETDATKRRMMFFIVGLDGITPATDQAGGQPKIMYQGQPWTTVGIGVLTNPDDSIVGANLEGEYYATLTQNAVSVAGRIISGTYKSGVTARIPADRIQVVSFNPAASHPVNIEVEDTDVA